MGLQPLFPTYIYLAKMPVDTLRRQILREIKILQEIDDEGLAWSKENYFGGYTSYSSMTKLHMTSPYFAQLASHIEKHAIKYAQKIGALRGRLELTDMWVNVMPKGVHHSSHIHPHSVISGTFYVQTPKGSSPITLEDPRLPLFMCAPERTTHHKITANNNTLVLFESWLRHEVPAQKSSTPRISVSFNLA